MKKVIFTFLLALAGATAFSQTYYWVGGTTATSFSAASNWNTQLGGGGTALPASISGTNSVGFTFIISGLDLSSAAGTQSGPLTVDFSGTINIGQLILENTADVTLSRTTGSTGTTTITIQGLAGPDLVLNPFCKLSLTGTSGSMFVSLGASATAEISGDIALIQGATSGNNNRFTAATKGSFVFLSGSTCTTASTYNSYPFNTLSSSTPAGQKSVVFNAGSSFIFNGGLSPWGSTSVSVVADFLPGSKFYLRAPNAPNMFNGKVYPDLTITNNATITADGSLYRVDSLTVTSGSTLILDTTGSTPVMGHILNDGTIQSPAVDPYRNNRMVLAGSSPQTLSGTGTYKFADVIVSNASNITLNKSIQVDTVLNIFGTLNPNGNSITGAGTVNIKAPASVNVTGDIYIDSFAVKNVSNLATIEVGMSVSGTGIPAGTVVTNLSTTSNTITLSKVPTATAAASALTVFNGTGTLLPLSWKSFTGSAVGNSAKLNWVTVNESNMLKYELQKSADGRSFATVYTTAAKNSAADNNYSFTDADAKGLVYYRVVAVGRSGDTKYSNVIKLSIGKAALLQVYPNPAVDVISVSGIQANDQVRVLDMKGNTVIRQQAVSGANAVSINVSALVKGTYIVEVSRDGSKEAKTFIKN